RGPASRRCPSVEWDGKESGPGAAAGSGWRRSRGCGPGVRTVGPGTSFAVLNWPSHRPLFADVTPVTGTTGMRAFRAVVAGSRKTFVSGRVLNDPLTRAHSRQRLSQQERKSETQVDPGVDRLAGDVARPAHVGSLGVDQTQAAGVVLGD